MRAGKLVATSIEPARRHYRCLLQKHDHLLPTPEDGELGREILPKYNTWLDV